MAKSMVEKYEQILSADPGSMVFVELAKALLDRGEHPAAIKVCENGLVHHPESVVGRVLWGKALINCGQPVQAMEQFDQAIAIDRENPYAYNLIGEVLLHKGLHRSALPILKKAVALQPTDNRVRQWLDQTTRALNGDKEPVAPQYTAVDMAPLPEPTSPDGFPGAEATVTDAKAYVPAPRPAFPADDDAPEVLPGMTDIFQSLSAREAARPHVEPAPTPAEEQPLPPIVEAGEPAPPVAEMAALEAAVSERPEDPLQSEPTVNGAPTRAQLLEGGLASSNMELGEHEVTAPGQPAPKRAPEPTRAAAPSEATLEPAPPDAFFEARSRDPAATAAPPDDPFPGERVVMSRAPTQAEAPLPDELLAATLALPHPAPDKTFPGPPPPGPVLAEAGAREPDATADLPLTPPPLNLSSRPKLAVAPPAGGPPPLRKSGPTMLPDLPELPSAARSPSMELPKVELSSQAAEAIAKEYEAELREKLETLSRRPPSFWSRNGLKLGLSLLAVAVVGIGIGVFRYTKRKTANIPALLAQAHVGLEKDTDASYTASLSALSDVTEASPKNAEGWALTAYAQAVLYREHGQAAAHQAAASAALAMPGVSEGFADLAQAARYELADTDEARDAAATALRSGSSAEAHEISGKRLLAKDPRGALAEFQASLHAQPSHVRTYLALGRYYLDKDEPARAYEMFDKAKTISDHHPGALLGLAQARLEQGKELEEAQADVGLVEKSEATLDEATRAQLDLVAGRLLAERGQPEEALARLQAGLARDASQAVAFHQALAEVYLGRGAPDKAYAELALALREHPKDPALVEAAARALVAEGKGKEALALTEPLADDRRIHLVRGIARFERGEYDLARKELFATRREKSMPTEAAIYLVRTELASGHKDDARAALKAIAGAGKLSSKALVAKGELALADGDAAAALTAFAAAAADPHEAEGPYLLGRTLLAEGSIAQAQAPLEQALERNHFLDEAQLPLGHALLGLAKPDDALPHLQAYLKAHKDAPLALAGLARVNLAHGSLADARRFAALATRHAPRDPEVAWTRIQVGLAAGDGSAILRELEKQARSSRGSAGSCDLGEALLDQGDDKGATEAFTKALKAEKESLRARVGLAIATARFKPSRASVHALDALAEPATKLPPMLLANVLGARALLGSNREAKVLAPRAVEARDGSALAHLALGTTLGKTSAAIPELLRAVALEPASAAAHLALAEAYAGTGQRSASMTEAGIARRIAPHGPSAEAAQKLLGGSAGTPAASSHHASRRHRKKSK